MGPGATARVSGNAAETPWLEPSWLLLPSKESALLPVLEKCISFIKLK